MSRAAGCYSVAYLAAAALLLTLHGPATSQKRSDKEIITEFAVLRSSDPHVIYSSPGGDIQEHHARYSMLRIAVRNIEIRGSCASACTLVLHHFPKERLCFGENAALRFHKASLYTGEPSLEHTLWMVKGLPQDIRTWITDMGGIEAMPHDGAWTLRAPQLWQMGYKRCGEP
jgi:hypothetical protein